MKSISYILLLFIFSSIASFAQQQKLQLKLDHLLNSNPAPKRNILFSSFPPDTLFVYAIRVQFQPDNDPNTTGNGRMDLSNSFPDSIDAPPHNDRYFNDHLEFLKNYYTKASKGKLTVVVRLVADLRNMSNVMSAYSPGRNENLQKMGTLFYEAWRSADSVYDFSGINPQKSAFVIFHAGAGRDIDLASQGILQGQSDIPSLYLGLSTLKSIYGDTTQGYYTQEGLIINNSAILPEQEYRSITSFSTFFLELGINGILTATIGSHLGLPDLFDTHTGKTAIGRFGLMDGQSIFSFSGVFPPEPSAWEKYYMGWVEPIPVISNGTYSSIAASLDDGTHSVYKVLIDAKEYFLIENRNRDAHKDSSTIYYRQNSDTLTHTMSFTKDQDGFQNGDIWKLKGDIIDVDELDWSLPGLINDTADYQGGILIWHIDENVIDARLRSNTINTDITHRGVDLEEAKGAQDIGVEIGTPFGTFIGDGTLVDYWYLGYHYVPDNIYRNEFTPSSFPNSKSYANIDSRVCIRNFTPIDSVMNFTFEVCSAITNINSFPRFVGIDTTGNSQPIGFDYNGNGLDEIFININDTLFGFRDNGNPIRVDAPNGYLKDSASTFIPAYVTFGGNKYVAGNYKDKINLYSFTIDSTTTGPVVQTVQLSNSVASPLLYLPGMLFSGMVDGKIAKLNLGSFTIAYDSVSSRMIIELAEKISNPVTNPLYYIDDQKNFLTAGNLSGSSQSDSITVFSNNKIAVNGNLVPFNQSVSKIYSSPVPADINKDGSQELIFTADDKVFAINRFGVVADNFPFKVTGVNKISSGCAIADLNNDGFNDVIFGTGDGRVYAYGSNGRVLDGFPLLTGREIKSTPALVNYEGKFGIVVYSTDGYLYGWKTSWDYDSSRVIWRNFLNNKEHRNINTLLQGTAVTGPCLPKERAYNWPNPVYDNKTQIRYFLGGSASSVKIRIMDLSGELVATLTGTANTGYDNEVTWDVSTVQSGIYIGVIELAGGNCSETVSIKIAVVK